MKQHVMCLAMAVFVHRMLREIIQFPLLFLYLKPSSVLQTKQRRPRKHVWEVRQISTMNEPGQAR